LAKYRAKILMPMTAASPTTPPATTASQRSAEADSVAAPGEHANAEPETQHEAEDEHHDGDCGDAERLGGECDGSRSTESLPKPSEHGEVGVNMHAVDAACAEGRKPSGTMHLVRAVALLLLTVALLSGCGGSEASSVVVPALVGLRESLATQTAEGKGLKAEVTHGPDKDMRKGFVYSQSIREGSIAHEGDTIKIVVSTG
jgi:hypothetical protein